jgi:beta-mannosidase
MLRVAVAGQRIDVLAALRKGGNRVEAAVTIPNPRLWWPAGEGEQTLYRLTVEWFPQSGEAGGRALPVVRRKQDTDSNQSVARGAAASDRYEAEIGLRTVELVRRKDAAGESFTFRVNGRDVYCRGANWIPDDVFPTRTTRRRLEFLLDSALAADMNMLRVWGGGIYATDEFLRLCDRRGIMLWHDFMFACAAYPAERWFLASVEAEMRHQIRRMMNHPSVVLWCGNNENQTAIDSWWAALPEHRCMRRAYDRLTYGVQQRVVRREDPGRPWIPSSPTGCPRRPEYPFGSEARGDMHYWEVWHRRKDFANYLNVRPRFSSEFGFQSFPSLETLRTVAGPEDMNVTSPVMEHHQRHRAGNSIITDFLTREFRFPGDFGDFCYLSQVNHGRSMKTAIEHWRRIKPRCMGTLYWQFNDDWPAASWSGIDWTLRWKALHYMARRFYAPLLGSVSDDASGLRLWATSDVASPLRGSWRVEAWTHAGRRVWTGRGRFALAANESQPVAVLARERILKLGGGAQRVFLVTEVRSGRRRSRNVHFFAPLKSADLPRARIRATVRRVGNVLALRLDSSAPAFHVELSTGGLRGVFSDNILTLLPRRSVTVHFAPDRPTTPAALRKHLKIRDVRSTY